MLIWVMSHLQADLSMISMIILLPTIEGGLTGHAAAFMDMGTRFAAVLTSDLTGVLR